MTPNDIEMQKCPPLQIGVIIMGEWSYTRKPLEYLILYLNTKQTLFEYQLISYESVTDRLVKTDKSKDLLESLKRTSEIGLTKKELKTSLNEISSSIRAYIFDNYCMFDPNQIPYYYIFISPCKHEDETFFQFDGTNDIADGMSDCIGGIILTGHHKVALSPPTVIEFIFKFLFRISIKWLYPGLTRAHRHYGQKGCLFDYAHQPSLLRYMILNNFICTNCKQEIGEETSSIVLGALDPSNLYNDEIDRHPANISSKLGFNLSLTKGIYKSKKDIFIENLNESFSQRVGSALAIIVIVLFSLMLGVDLGGVISSE